MILIVGLGNPGKEYVDTRHNVGWRVVNGLVERWGGKWEMNKKVEGIVASCKLLVASKEEVYLLKPMTFMNRSGETVRKFAEFYKPGGDFSGMIPRTRGIIPSKLRVFLIHDDVDLELGRLKIQMGGGSAGHRGVESVKVQSSPMPFGAGQAKFKIQNWEWEQMVRFRMGVGRPDGNIKNQISNIKNKESATHLNKSDAGRDWVLRKFTQEEERIVSEMIERTAEAVEVTLREGVEAAMNRFN